MGVYIDPTNSRLNQAEGWDIGDDGSGCWQIVRMDEMEVFDSDVHAYMFVLRGALDGSERHAAALYVHGLPMTD